MDDTIRAAAADAVVARVQQAYDLNVAVTFVPAREIPGILRLGCQPRQGAQRTEVDPVELPEPTRRFLLEVNAAVTEWLARDASHQAAFLADPVAALSQAGIRMERSHLKAIARVREQAAAAEAVAPGLQVRTVETAVNLKGRIRPEAPDRQWSPPPVKDDHDCGCGSKEKE